MQIKLEHIGGMDRDVQCNHKSSKCVSQMCSNRNATELTNVIRVSLPINTSATTTNYVHVNATDDFIKHHSNDHVREKSH
jgi:hypothetical protein